MSDTPPPLVSAREAKKLGKALLRAKPDATEADFVRLVDAYGRHEVAAGLIRLALSGELGLYADADGEFRFSAPPDDPPEQPR